jgi:hypothetical protein
MGSPDFTMFFRRFEQAVDIRSFNKNYDKLHMAIAGYAGKKWTDSPKQQEALTEIAYNKGFKNITITEWVVPTRRLTARAKWGKRALIGHGAPARKARKAKKSASHRAFKIELVKDYVDKKYSANRIQRELKSKHEGIRRKELLKIIRRYKKQQIKKNPEKYIRKRYRKK